MADANFSGLLTLYLRTPLDNLATALGLKGPFRNKSVLVAAIRKKLASDKQAGNVCRVS